MKLLLTTLLEDLDVRDMVEDNVGLYAFIQAINKNANESPVPMPTLNIDLDNTLDRNPGPISWSHSSVKIPMNPNAAPGGLNGSNHDIIHLLTLNLLKHFARKRPNTAKHPTYGRDPLYARANQMKPQATRIKATGGGIDRGVNIARLNKASDEGAHWWRRMKYGDPSDVLPEPHPDSVQNYPDIETRPMYMDRYGHLPQYGKEEAFGNAIRKQISDLIETSKPINFNIDKLSFIDAYFGEKDQSVPNSHARLLSKYKDFLLKVFETYNSLLERYKKINGS